MDTYFVDYDCFDGLASQWYTVRDYETLLEWVKQDLEEMGGGHADIYDEDDDFIEDVEL